MSAADPFFLPLQTALESAPLPEAIALADDLLATPGGLSIERTVKVLEYRGVALFGLGQAVPAIADLRRATDIAGGASLAVQLSSWLARFNRECAFQSPAEFLPDLAHLRQLATAVGDAPALANLHLSVARLEALRGYFIDAHRHLELAKHLASPSEECGIDLVDASLALYAGNIDRADIRAKAGLERAKLGRDQRLLASTLGNYGFVSLFKGNKSRSRECLQQASDMSDPGSLVRLGALDSLACLALASSDLDEAARTIELCGALIETQSLPARSWYDLAHQVTKCTYFSLVGDWEEILAVAEEADAELRRRQLRALRTSLLCAKARALARLGDQHRAEQTLAMAVRSCPRGAVEPLISLETAKASCLALQGELERAQLHFERARGASRSTGNHYQQWLIEREIESLTSLRAYAVGMPAAEVSVSHTATLLSDISAILGAGHSIDLLAQRVSAIFASTSLGPRLEIKSTSGRQYEPTPSASSEARPDGTHIIRVQGSDRRVEIRVTHVETLDEVSFVKGIVDVIQAAVGRANSTAPEEDEQNLWPRAAPPAGDDPVFLSPRMQELRRIAERLAATDLTVLVSGETGTGKEVVARLIHEASRVRRGPFVPFNCSAIARELVESQLFGHRRGAFTGATESFQGVIRAANGGTLFLDEIGDLDLHIQPKFLRFLESGEVQPVGEVRPAAAQVRVIAATNANLAELVAQGRFRTDLLFRLRVAQVWLPPLRERKDEIPTLAALFVSQAQRKCGRAGIRIGDDFMAALLLHDWPGNIRELANEIRRAVAMADDGHTLAAIDLSPEVTEHWQVRRVPAAAPDGPNIVVDLDQPLEGAVDQLERAMVERALASTAGRVAEAATRLGLSRKGLFLKRRRWGLLSDQE